jgi:hypothetical protein
VVDGKGLSPLYLAIISNRVDLVEILVRKSCDGERSPASYAGPNGQTALHAARSTPAKVTTYMFLRISFCWLL